MIKITLKGIDFLINLSEGINIDSHDILCALRNNEGELINVKDNEELLILDKISVICIKNKNTIHITKVISSINTF